MAKLFSVAVVFLSASSVFLAVAHTASDAGKEEAAQAAVRDFGNFGASPTVSLAAQASEGVKEFQREHTEMVSVAEEFNHRDVSSFVSERARLIENGIQPLVKTLPKNENELLDTQVAKFVLHRYFDSGHHWSVHGLSPSKPSTEEDVFSQLTAANKKGFSTESLSLVASIMEEHIQNETIYQMRDIFRTKNVAVTESLSHDHIYSFVEMYMTIYISGMRYYDLKEGEYRAQMRFMHEKTQDWAATLQWVKTTVSTELWNDGPCKQQALALCQASFSFLDLARVIQNIVDSYGKYNVHECQRLKSTMLSMEDRSTGRVSLAQFYKRGTTGTWEFNEKVEYLRDLGVLDESMPGFPRVIVVNYVNSWVNCLSSSSIYSVCCRHECDDIMDFLERRISMPAAQPDWILTELKEFQSTNIKMPKTISTNLINRLQRIADTNVPRGVVPLQGRLFAQWLHHLLPQTCAFPVAEGSANPLTPDQWVAQKGHDSIAASKKEIDAFLETINVDGRGAIQSSRITVQEDDLDDGASDMPWSDDENIIRIAPTPVQEDPRPRWHLNATVMVLELVSVMGLIVVMLRYVGLGRSRKGQASNGNAYANYAV